MTAKKPNKKSGSETVAKKQYDELEDSYKRLAAEFANFQRRSEQDSSRLGEHVRTELLEKLFPIMDNLYRASIHAPAIDVANFGALTEDDFKKIATYFEGLRQIEKQLEATLQQAGLTRIATRGEVFNPNLHEAISYEANMQVPADHIIDEVESGWQINGRVVRPAKVRVSQG